MTIHYIISDIRKIRKRRLRYLLLQKVSESLAYILLNAKADMPLKIYLKNI